MIESKELNYKALRCNAKLLNNINPTQHYDRCYREHPLCTIITLCDEIDRLSASLAAKDAEIERLTRLLELEKRDE